MKTKRLLPVAALFGIVAAFALGITHAETNAPPNKPKVSDSPLLDVDKVVASPEKWKGKIRVTGRVSKVDADKKLLVLGCEDACVAMPVKFSGEMPKQGSDVVVHGQITKDAQGRYLFDAETVAPKK